MTNEERKALKEAKKVYNHLNRKYPESVRKDANTFRQYLNRSAQDTNRFEAVTSKNVRKNTLVLIPIPPKVYLDKPTHHVRFNTRNDSQKTTIPVLQQTY